MGACYCLVGLDELSGDDVLQTFFRERKLDGDIIARISDELWLRGANANSINFEEVSDNQNFNAEQALDEVYYILPLHFFLFIIMFCFSFGL